MNVSLHPTGLTLYQKRFTHTHEFAHSYERLFLNCGTLAPLDTLIPAFFCRKCNQSRLTLEMLSAKMGGVAFMDVAVLPIVQVICAENLHGHPA